MGPVIVFLLLALIVAIGLLAVVAKPHWDERRRASVSTRHTSRSQRAGS